MPVAQGAEEIRFSAKRGIAGYVAMSGESVIIDDAYTRGEIGPDTAPKGKDAARRR